LSLTGAHDFITPPEPGAERIANLIPNAEVAIFDNSGHYPFIEEQAAFFARLRTFLGHT
jgi:proline iminopeptidase